MLCRSHPLRGANPQRNSAALVFRALTRGSALMLWVSAMRNCVSNGVRTSRCRADFFRLSKSRCGLPSRRAPDRLAALLTAFRLSIAFCLRRAFTGGSDPAFTAAGIEPAPCQMAALFRCCAAYKRRGSCACCTVCKL